MIKAGGKDIIIFDVENINQKPVPGRHQIPNLFEEQNTAKIAIVDSSISSILLKPLLEFYIPIINEIPKVDITIRDLEKRSNIKVESKVDVEKGITIIFDQAIECIFRKKNSAIHDKSNRIKIAAGQMVVVLGLYLPSKFKSRQWIEVYDYLATNSKYNILDILKSGSYGPYNCYKNYFSNAYIGATLKPILKIENTILFTNKSEENNIKLRALYQISLAINEIYNTVYLLTLKSNFLTKPPIKKKIPPRSDVYVSDERNLVIWLVANKLIDKTQVHYLNMNVEFMQAVNKIKWHGGSKEAESKPYVDKLRQLIDAEISANNERIKIRKFQIEIANKRTISYNKFSTTNLFELTPAQQKNVIQEYNKENAKNSKEIKPLSPLITKLTFDINAEDTKELNKSFSKLLMVISKDDKLKFEKQLKSKDILFTQYIKLKDADQKICPHILEYASRTINSELSDIMAIITNKYGSLETSSAVKVKRDQRDTYCRICGELLAEYDEEEVVYKEKDNYILTIEDDEIFTMVKRELIYVISYYTEQPTDSPISLGENDNIIDLLSGIIRTKVIDIQNGLIKIKTMVDNDMWLLINIYIYIYIFAVLTQFIFANPEVLLFKQVVAVGKRANINTWRKNSSSHGGKSINITNSSKEILQKLLKPKKSQHNLERLINHALELIKKVKYSDIINSKYIIVGNIKELFLDAYKWTMTLNYNIESIDDFTNNPQSDFQQTDIYQNNILNYFSLHGKLGRNYQQIESDLAKSTPIYKTIQINKNADLSTQLLYNYIIQEKYLIKPIPANSDYIAVIGEFTKEKQIEAKNNLLYKAHVLRPSIFHSKYDIHSYKLDLPFKLVSNCKKECAVSYVYQLPNKKGNEGLQEFSKEQIVGWLESNNVTKLKELYSLNSLGSKCVCKESKNQQLVLFYKYFEQFCPKGELHDYNEKKCKKCGITDELIKSMNVDFYKKYKDVLSKTRKEEADLTNKEVQERLDDENNSIKRFAKNNKSSAKFPMWESSIKEISEFIKRINIKNAYNLFCCIGLYENLDYKKIESNLIQPYINTSPDVYMNQALSIHNYILYIYRNYYIAKNSEFTPKLPFDLKNLLSKSAQNNKDFSSKLADLDMTYIEKYDWYSGERIKPELLANFCLVYLAKTFTTIDENFKRAKLEKFGNIWLQFYLAKVIGFERYLCAIKLKNLKPLARYEEAEDEMEDADALNSKFGEESSNEAVDQEYEETGNEFANQDVDLGEGDNDDLNQDNSFATID